MGYDMQMTVPPEELAAGYVPPLPGQDSRFLFSNDAMYDMVEVMAVAGVMDAAAATEDLPPWPPRGISQKRVDKLGAVFCVDGAEGAVGHDCIYPLTGREERLFEEWAQAANAILTRRSEQPGKVPACKFASQRPWFVCPEECHLIAEALLAMLEHDGNTLIAPCVRSGMTPTAAAAWIRKWALYNRMAAGNGGYRVS